MKKNSKTSKKLAYEVITDKLIEMIEKKKVLPWHLPWKVNGEFCQTQNYKTKHTYRGINAFLTQLAVHSYGYSSPYFLTFNQATDLGGHVKKGESGLPVIYWNFIKKTEINPAGESEEVSIPIAKYYTVFNVDQIEGIELNLPKPTEEVKHDPIKDCEKVLKNKANKPEIIYGSNRACYAPLIDKITIPKIGQFDKVEEFYSTLFHELVHSTGHKKRLNRVSVVDLCPFGTTNYGKEELIAEMGAAFLCGYCKIDNTTIDNSAAYLNSWLKTIKQTPKLLIEASGAAQKAVDYLLGVKKEEE